MLPQSATTTLHCSWAPSPCRLQILLVFVILPTLYAFPFRGAFLPAPCIPSTCPPLNCSSDSQVMDEYGCCAVCVREKGERCGGGGYPGVSEPCKAGLTCMKRLGSIFGEARRGICEDARCRNTICSYRQRCVVRNSSPTCSCGHFQCSNKMNLVCGVNNVTYESVCAMQEKECLTSTPIGIATFEKCEVYTPTKPPPPSPTKTNKNINFPPPPRSLTCFNNGEDFALFHIVPPSRHHHCLYYVCSEYGFMDEYTIPGCEGGPIEEDWDVETPVHAPNWCEWSDFSRCHGNCSHGGWRNRVRTCSCPSPDSSASHVDSARNISCVGEEEEWGRCGPDGCEMCRYTEWSPWSDCSTTCSGGVTMRNRTVDQPPVPELCRTREQQQKGCSPNDCEPCRMLYIPSAPTRPVTFRNEDDGCVARYYDSNKPLKYCSGVCTQGNHCCRIIPYNGPFPLSEAFHFSMLCPGSSDSKLVRPFYKCTCKPCSHRLDAQPFYMLSPWVQVT